MTITVVLRFKLTTEGMPVIRVCLNPSNLLCCWMCTGCAPARTFIFEALHLNQHSTLARELNVLYLNNDEPQLSVPRIDFFRMGYKYQFVNVWNQIAPGLKKLPN